MTRRSKIAAALLVTAMSVTACTTNPETGQKSISKK